MAKSIEMTVEVDMSKMKEFQELLKEVKELHDMVPEYLSHEKEARLDRILYLSKQCYHIYRN